MEFKGTKQLKILHSNQIGIGLGKIEKSENVQITVWDNTEESKANALLISKAPEMLRLLKDTYLHIDALSRKMKDPTYSQGMKCRAEEIKQLIKESTTL